MLPASPLEQPGIERSQRWVDVRVLIEALLHRWKTLLLPLFIVPIVGVGLRLMIPLKVKASAQVLVQESVKVNPFLKDMMVEWSVNSRLPVVQSILQSSKMLERVKRELGEITDATPPPVAARMIAQFKKEIEVFGEGGGLVRISVAGFEPDKVFSSLKILTGALIEEMLRPQRQVLDESVKFLKVQIDRVKGELQSCEEEIKEFKKKYAGDLPEVHKLNLDNHLSLMKDLYKAEAEMAVAEQRAKSTSGRVRDFDPELRKVASKLKRARQALAGLRGTYTDNHYKVQAQRAVVAGLENALERLEKRESTDDPNAKGPDVSPDKVGVEHSVGGDKGSGMVLKTDDPNQLDMLEARAAKLDAESLKEKVALYHERVKSSFENVRGYAEREQTLTRLLRTQEAKSKTLASLQDRYEDTLVKRDLTSYDEAKLVWVVEEPQQPIPVGGFTLPMVGILSLFGGLILGFLLVVLREFLDRSLRSRDEVESLVGVPVIGTLPRLEGRGA